jgi:hypothetical protein
VVVRARDHADLQAAGQDIAPLGLALRLRITGLFLLAALGHLVA